MRAAMWSLSAACLAAAAVLAMLSVSVPEGSQATAPSMPESETPPAGHVAGAGTFGDETINTLLQKDGLEHRAANGDNDAIARLARAKAVLDQLRTRAESGDVEAASLLHGKLSLAGRADEALEVLRMPSVRDTLHVQRLLTTILPNMMLERIRHCEEVEATLLSEYISVLQALSLKGDELATAYLVQISSLADQSSARKVMEKLYPSLIPPECGAL